MDRIAIDTYTTVISPTERVTFQNVKIFEVAKRNVCAPHTKNNLYYYLKNIFFETDFME